MEEHPPATLNLAVGLDHQLMLNNNYKFYAASWTFLTQVLAKKHIKIVAHPMPWARAKTKVLRGELDGLFLAANFKGRDQWAELTTTLGFDYFGYFKQANATVENDSTGMVRVGEHDKIHSEADHDNIIEVATAQVGLQLLGEGKIGRFLLSKGYGEYLLSRELKAFQSSLYFDQDSAEKRSSHVAISKAHKQRRNILKLLNRAIKAGIEQGTYQQVMDQRQVPCENRVICATH